MTEQKPRRHRRTKANIVASIEQAAREEIAQNGFVASLVTNIIKSAKIEPQVFYNRYKGINDFYDAFVRRYDSCLDDVLDNVADPIVSKEGLISLFKEIMRSVNQDPVALELLRWELCDRNKTTTRSSLLRELNFQPLMQGLERCFRGTNIDITGMFVVIIGGIYYLSLHKKLSPFYGVDLDTEEGREKIENTVELLMTLVFDSISINKREKEIADRLRRYGVKEEIIKKAFAPTSSDISAVSIKKNQPQTRPA